MPGYTLPLDADIDSDYRHEATALGFVPVGTPQGGKWHYDIRGRRGARKPPHHRDRAAVKPSLAEINFRKWASARIINLINGLPANGLPQVHQARPALPMPARVLIGTFRREGSVQRRAA